MFPYLQHCTIPGSSYCLDMTYFTTPGNNEGESEEFSYSQFHVVKISLVKQDNSNIVVIIIVISDSDTVQFRKTTDFSSLSA